MRTAAFVLTLMIAAPTMAQPRSESPRSESAEPKHDERLGSGSGDEHSESGCLGRRNDDGEWECEDENVEERRDHTTGHTDHF